MAQHPAWSTGPAGRGLAALSALTIVAVHVVDQGGFPGDKEPGYIGVGYWVLELAGVLAALALLLLPGRAAWFLALGVAAGPLLGYVLSRGPGLPDYTDDRGNWAEPLGLFSLAVEAVLLLLAVAAVARAPQRVEVEA